MTLSSLVYEAWFFILVLHSFWFHLGQTFIIKTRSSPYKLSHPTCGERVNASYTKNGWREGNSSGRISGGENIKVLPFFSLSVGDWFYESKINCWYLTSFKLTKCIGRALPDFCWACRWLNKWYRNSFGIEVSFFNLPH